MRYFALLLGLSFLENMFSLLFNVVPEDVNDVDIEDEPVSIEPKSPRRDLDPFDDIAKDVGNKDIPIIE